MSMEKISRREFLKGAGIGAALILTGGTDIFRGGGLFGLPAAKAFAMEEPFMPDAEIAIRSLEKWVQITSGDANQGMGL